MAWIIRAAANSPVPQVEIALNVLQTIPGPPPYGGNVGPGSLSVICNGNSITDYPYVIGMTWSNAYFIGGDFITHATALIYASRILDHFGNHDIVIEYIPVNTPPFSQATFIVARGVVGFETFGSDGGSPAFYTPRPLAVVLDTVSGNNLTYSSP